MLKLKELVRRIFITALNLLPDHFLANLVNAPVLKNQFRHYIRPGRDLQVKLDDPYLNKVTLTLNRKYPIENSIVLHGHYDTKTLSLLDLLIQPSYTCFDVGANIGSIGFFLAKKIQNSGEVFLFEPGPPNYQRLMYNMSLNPELVRNIQSYQLGFSDSRKKLFWREVEDNLGNAEFHEDDGLEIELQTMDWFVDKNRLKRLDFIKIDVEGMELEVLKGAEKTLRTFHPMIYYESVVDEKNWGEKLESLEVFLIDQGYQLFAYDESINGLNKVGYPDYDQNTLAIHQTNLNQWTNESLKILS